MLCARFGSTYTKESMLGTSLVVPEVKNPPSTAGAVSSTPGWGNKIPQAEWHSQKFFK